MVLTIVCGANKDCGQGDKLIIGIEGLPNGAGNPQDFVVNGQPRGFDIALYCQIAARLGKNIIFKQIVGTGLNELSQGVVDMVGGTTLAINNMRLANFGFVRTDLLNPPTSGCLSLIFLTNNIYGLTAGSNPDSVLQELAQNQNVKFIGGKGPGTVQFITLVDDGFNENQIVNLNSLPVTSQDYINALTNGYNGKSPIAAIYVLDASTAAPLVNGSNGVLSFLPCVPLATEVAPLGAGIAFRKDCCRLMLQVQWGFE